MGICMRRASLAGWLFFLLSAPRLAVADVSPTDRATAQALFDQAKQLAASAKYAEACPKFEESERLDPGIGTQFQLANCYEHAGRIASAWTLFLDVASAARGMKQPEREKVARDRAAALEAKIPKLTIAVAGADKSPDLEIKRDGVLVGRAQWGAALPSDPGEHVVTANAPGKKPFEKRVQLAASATVSVAIPPLENADAAPAGTSAGATTLATTGHVDTGGRPGSSQRTIGLVVAGVGVVGLGVGGVLGLAAKSKFNEASGECDDSGCSQAGVALRHSAVSRGNVATVVFGIGIAGIAVGGVLWATSPKGEAHVAVGPGSISFMGRF
jgi:hypothetical protein